MLLIAYIVVNFFVLQITDIKIIILVAVYNKGVICNCSPLQLHAFHSAVFGPHTITHFPLHAQKCNVTIVRLNVTTLRSIRQDLTNCQDQISKVSLPIAVV